MTTKSRAMSRRGFLGAGAAAALGPWMGGFGGSIALPVAGCLPVGYLSDSESVGDLGAVAQRVGRIVNGDAMPDRFPNFSEGSLGRVVDARAVAGDGAGFAQGAAEVRFAGLFVPEDLRRGGCLRSVSVDVLYAVAFEDGERELPFHAWHYAVSPFESVSHAGPIRVPLDGKGGLRFSIDLKTSQGETTIPLRLSGARNDGEPGLRRGLYLLAFANSVIGTGGLPHWRRHVWAEVPDADAPRLYLAQPCLLSRGASSSSFPYLAFTVDRPGQAA